MTKKDTGAEPENKESRSFRSSAMREPLFGSYTEEQGEKKIEKGMPGNRSTSVHHSANDGSPRHGIILIHL